MPGTRRTAGSAALVLAGDAMPLRPEPALFEAMLEGWRRQQGARRLSGPLIEGRARLVRRFRGFTGAWPWQWSPAQVEAWIASGGWAHSTVRSYEGALAVFLEYVCDPRYGWVAECEQRVGARPVQVCHEGNTAVHAADYEGRPERRPLTRAELQAFFDAADDHVERAAGSRRKGWLAAFRDAAVFKVVYGWGLRRREPAMLDVADFTANPAAPEFGSLGICHVRYGKAMRGSPPRRRAVATVMPWAAGTLQQYLGEVRPWYGCEAHPALWLTERGGRISPRQVDDRFAAWRAAAGLPRELSVDCLRHSYISHLIEDGADPLFVQQQAGHSWASTTATYTTVGQDARNRMLRAALAPVFGEGGRHTVARKVGYHWHLRRLMAEREIYATTGLQPLLAERGVTLSKEQVWRLVTGTPERLSLATLAALCDILGCQPGDIIEPVASSGGGKTRAQPGGPRPRPLRARVLPGPGPVRGDPR